MENRFGIKDLFIFLLLGVIIVMVVLCMMQYERQWSVINQANSQLQNQTRDLATIRRLIEQGGIGAPTTNRANVDDLTTGFDRIIKSHARPDYAPGDAIVATFAATPPAVTPFIARDVSGNAIIGYVLDSLCSRDPQTLEWKPHVAKSWHISDDLLTIDFELKRGITFSDGEPLTAVDVVFTMNQLMNKDIEAEWIRTVYDRFDHIEKTGDYSVRFKFNKSYFQSFENAAGIGILSKKFYSQFDAKTFNESTGLLLGSGPYRLADSKGYKPEPGKPIELIRNERYWGIPPAADRMIWKVIENPSARTTAFGNGETDSFGPTPEQYDNLLKEPDLVARTQHFSLNIPNSGFSYIGWLEETDGKRTRFADKRVRRAMTQLIDREAICKDILRGHATVNSSPFSAMTPQSDPQIKPWPYNPEAAQKLLADAGYHKVNDTLVGPDGQPFRFKLTYNSSNPVRTQIASFTKDSLAKAGIIVDPDPGEWSVILKKMQDHHLDALIIGWGGGIEDDPYDTLSTAATAKAGNNNYSYSNPELDAAMQTARAMANEPQRMLAWHKVHRIIHEDQPYTFLFTQQDLEFIDGRFKGVEPLLTGVSPDGEWYTPVGAQKYKP